MDFQTLHQLSKTELHCHLDGSLSLSCIRQLAKMIDRKLPATDDELRRLVQAPADSENLGDYLKAFDFVAPFAANQKRPCNSRPTMSLNKRLKKTSAISKFALRPYFS